MSPSCERAWHWALLLTAFRSNNEGGRKLVWGGDKVTGPEPELFLSKGLLPENMPPVFTSQTLWGAFASLGSNYGIMRDSVGDAALFNASKRGGQRRLFKTPHPAFIRDQALFLHKHWPELSALIERSPGSVSKPSFHTLGPRHVRITGHSDLPRLRLRAFSRFKFCLVTDVSRFFPSVYTHSLPWAINGKAAAKGDSRHNSQTVYGNRIDFILRQSQSRQTVGIAVGPDASKVISEVLMSSVDALFVKNSGRRRPTFIRHVDDYWVAGNSHEECEKHLSNLRIALRDHELDINESKTKIISTKYVFGDNWPFEFDRELKENLSYLPFSSSNPLPILSKIVDQATQTNDDGIIRHVIRQIDDNGLWTNNWEILEHFLAQCAVQFPHSFDYVARVIAWRLRRTMRVDKSLWQEIARSVAQSNGLIGRDTETVWALWLLKELGSRLPKTLTDAIVENSGGLVLALLAHFGSHKLVADRHLKENLWDIVNGDPLAGAYWPLTLEMWHLGIGQQKWLAGAATPSLKALHVQKKSIIDWKALPKVFESDGPDDADDEPKNALEDYGDDYGSYVEEADEGADDGFDF